MRILYSHRIQSYDGQGVHLESLVAALREAGHEVLVVGPSFYGAAGFGSGSRAVAMVRRFLPAAAQEMAELAYNLPAYRRLARAAAAFQPDVIYERANLFYLAGALIARRLSLPYLLEVNAPLADERSHHGNLRLRRLARTMEHWVWRSADRVLPVTQVLADRIAKGGVAHDKMAVIPNGIDLTAFEACEGAAKSNSSVVTLGFVGFVRNWHGLDAVIHALAAWKGSPRIDLVVVGDGPARPGLEQLAAELGVAGRVRFTGLVARDAIPGLVHGFDIALQPAAVGYASPLKVFEYMAAGRAIVAPDQANLREILESGRTAMLFDQGETGALWSSVLQLAQNETLRHRLGSAARADILRRDFTWAGNARRVATFATEAIQRRNRLSAPAAAMEAPR